MMSCTIPTIRVYSPSDSEHQPNHTTERRHVEMSAQVSGSVGSVASVGGNGGECEPKQISWDNTFHMRNMNLMNFSANLSTYRTTYRSSQSSSLHRARIGCITSTAKSLNILRQTLQHSINKEINEVIQKYLDKFFRPAIENIKNNNGINSVSDQHVQSVCRQMLEEAKKMYFAGLFTRSNSPISSAINSNPVENLSDNENNIPITDCRLGSRAKRNKDSDTDSETSSTLNTLKPVIARKKKATHKSHITHSNASSSDRSTPVKIHGNTKSVHSDGIKREGRKWDPTRLTTDTKFVLGSRANKALGFGTTRGRLYTKHADLFRYIGDQEDKQWLHDNHLMPPAGGRAYLLIKEDILDLIESEEYKNASGVNASDMGTGFTVPQNMINKMAIVMQNMRNSDMSRKKIENKSRIAAMNILPNTSALICENSSTSSGVDNSNQPSVETNRADSRAISPADDLEVLSTTELPSAGPSPFSIGASCFECDISPNENQEISPIASDVSTTTLNEIQL